MITTEEILSSEVRALSWKDPYGQAMLEGKIETRTWATGYRGLVLICISQKAYNEVEVRAISGKDQFDRLKSFGFTNKYLGTAIAIARLSDCRLMTAADEAATYVKYKGIWEEVKPLKGPNGKQYGIKKVKKRLYCHVYTDITPIHSIYFKGQQGWKTLNGDFIKSLIIPQHAPVI